MREPIGHEQIRRTLERFLPPVTLLYGPRGVGKWALGDYLLRVHGTNAADLTKVTKLSAESAQYVVGSMQIEPTSSPFRAALINVDSPNNTWQYAHNRNLARLLTTLELAQGKIILVASSPTSPAVEGRAVIYRLGLLSDVEVQQAMDRFGHRLSNEDAAKHKGTAWGRQLLEQEGYLKSNVDAVLKSLQEQDRALFNVSLQAWRNYEDGTAALQMLRGWICEALIGKWVRYTADSAPALAKDRAKLKAMLVDLNHYHGNAKIVAHAALDKHLGRVG